MKVQLKPEICSAWDEYDSRCGMTSGIWYDMKTVPKDLPGLDALDNPGVDVIIQNPETPDEAWFELSDLIGEDGEINQKNYPELYI